MILPIQIWLVIGTAAIHAVQIETRSAVVHQTIWVVLPLQAACGIKCKIVIDELTEIGVSGADGRVLLIVGFSFRRWRIFRFGAHGIGELPQHLFVELSGRQRAEKPAKTASELRGVSARCRPLHSKKKNSRNY